MLRVLTFLILFIPAYAYSAPVAAVVVTAAISGAAAASWTVFAASLLLGAISYALTPKLKAPSLGVQSSTITVRQSDLPRQRVYGHTRITTGYASIHATGVNSELHIVLILCEGPLRAINEVWLDDYSIPSDWINSDGLVTQGRYAGKLTIRKHLGDEDQLADSLLISKVPEIDSTFRLQGVAYLYLILKKDQDVYPNGVPNITAVVEGQTFYDPRTEQYLWSTNIALYAYDFIRSNYGFAAFEDDVDLTNISAQANICDEIIDVDSEWLPINSVNADNNLITLNGDVLPFEYGDVVRFRGEGLPSGLYDDTDFYVIPYQMRGTPRFAVALSLTKCMANQPQLLVDDFLIDAEVKKIGEPRYHGSGSFSSEENISEILNNIVSSMAGRAINVAGFWTLKAGIWQTPVVDYGVSDVRGQGITIQNSLSMSDSFNVVKGVFFSPLNNYQSSDYPSAYYQEFIDNDNGIESVKELNLPFTSRPTTAQRIAKIELFRGRQQIVCRADFSLKGMKVQTGDTVTLTMDRYGWDTKPFEVTEFNFSNEEGRLFTQMTLRETAQQIYDWEGGEAIDYDPAPNTNLTDIFTVYTPTGVKYNSRNIGTVDGDVMFTVVLEWNIHPDQFVTQYGDFEIQYKPSNNTTWLPSFFVDGSLNKSDVFNASVNEVYDIRIRARNNLGVRSSWSQLTEVTVGSSGGVTTESDWGSVADTPDEPTTDWGSVADTPDEPTTDWGFVT